MAKILVVDDTEIMRHAIELALRKMGHEVVGVERAADAVAAARAEPPDLALLDLRMPGVDGAMLYGSLRAELGSACPPVVFVTATAPELAPPSLVSLGIRPAGWVMKPFRLSELERAVCAALGLGDAVARA